jgi:hypothetical protein
MDRNRMLLIVGAAMVVLFLAYLFSEAGGVFKP